MAPIKGVIFDLDGTLVNTIADIAESSNHALEKLGYSPLPTDSYCTLAGNGNHVLLRRALRLSAGVDPSEANVLAGVEHKLAYERGPNGHRQSAPFQGAHAVLHALSAGGRRLAVLSNKAQSEVRRVVERMFGDVNWVYVAGATDEAPLKPDPTVARRIVEQCMAGVSVEECAFVGDTDVDMQTGNAAGMLPVGVAWGFRGEAELKENGAKYIAKEMADLVPFLESVK